MSNTPKSQSTPIADVYRVAATASGKVIVTPTDTVTVKPREPNQSYEDYYKDSRHRQGSKSSSSKPQVPHVDSTAESIAAQDGSHAGSDDGDETDAESVVAQYGGSEDGEADKKKTVIQTYPEGQGPPGSIKVKVTATKKK